ncbi:hypothetical protein BKA62DRAFT_672458 [Auriculariales sp. MPI-PUGE-AT-0066]|nr:hypothetical protein BKA62DRAFT_672458 [Auriculariales sp. MPI-PUGE-AT-0066]
MRPQLLESWHKREGAVPDQHTGGKQDLGSGQDYMESLSIAVSHSSKTGEDFTDARFRRGGDMRSETQPALPYIPDRNISGHGGMLPLREQHVIFQNKTWNSRTSVTAMFPPMEHIWYMSAMEPTYLNVVLVDLIYKNL